MKTSIQICLPVRYIQAILLFSSLVANYILRVNLSIAIVFMTDMKSKYNAMGFVMACIIALMSRWIPPVERGRCGALVLGGIHIGNLVSFSLSGWIGSTFGGWPSIFYFSGIIGVAWSILWILIGAESPKSCPFIHEEEKKYIELELAETPTLPKNLPIPWKEMLKSKACWAILLATIGHGWGYWTLVQLIPTYFNAIYEFSPTINGLVTSLPYGLMWLMSFPASYVTDKLITKQIISITACRKINNSIGHFGSAICLVVLAITRDPTVAIVMYTIGTAVISFAFIGYSINHMDIVPNFAGFLMGITNGLSNFSATSGPLFAGMVVRNTNNADEWGYVFYVSAAVFVAGNLTFITMGTAQIQDFNEIPKEFEVEEGKKTGSVVA